MVSLVVFGAAALFTFASIEFDPVVNSIIEQVSQDSLVSTVASLSGEKAVTIGGKKDSIPCRFAYSQGSYKAGFWLKEQLESRGVSVALEPFIPQNFSDVIILPSGKGWAVSSTYREKSIFATENSGQSWFKVFEDLTNQNNTCTARLVALSGDTIWYSCGGTIMCTFDGLNWTVMRNKNPSLYGICGINPRLGWAVGDWGVLVSTTDGWKTFKESYPPELDETLYQVCFISPGTGWSSSLRTLWVTHDGGETWTKLSQPLDTITDLVFTDSLRGYLAGINESGGVIYRTSDAGEHWQKTFETGLSIPYDISAVDSNLLWVAGSGGMVLFSGDAGESWKRKSLVEKSTLRAISVTSGGKGATAGITQIGYTDDAGESWHDSDTTGLGAMFNVIGTISGEDSAEIVIDAHYDATLFDTSMWMTYTPGADDNASGVSAVLESSRLLSGRTWKHTLRFACFDAEEGAGWGSYHYVGTKDAQNTVAFLNADMIAYDKAEDGNLIVSNYSAYNPLSIKAGEIIADVVDVYGLGLNVTRHDYWGFSDCDNFWAAGLAGIDLTEAELWGEDFNPFFHSVNDRLNALNPGYFTEVTKACVAWMAVMADMDSLVDVREKPFESQTDVVALTLSSGILRSRGYLTISSPCPVVPCIYDASGRKVKTLCATPSSSAPVRMDLDISDLPAGVYWVGVRGTGRQVSQRFVVIK